MKCGRPRFDPWVGKIPGEGNGNPLQYSCLENPMDWGAWWATVHGVTESDMTERLWFCFFHFPWWLRQYTICLQCRKPGFDPWVGNIPWRRKWQPTPVFLSGVLRGQRSLADCSSWGHKKSNTTEWLTLSLSQTCKKNNVLKEKFSFGIRSLPPYELVSQFDWLVTIVIYNVKISLLNLSGHLN